MFTIIHVNYTLEFTVIHVNCTLVYNVIHVHCTLVYTVSCVPPYRADGPGAVFPQETGAGTHLPSTEQDYTVLHSTVYSVQCTVCSVHCTRLNWSDQTRNWQIRGTINKEISRFEQPGNVPVFG